MCNSDVCKKKILFLVSGNGGLLQTVINACKEGILWAEVIGVITDKNCYALKRAEVSGISKCLLDRKTIGATEFQKNLYQAIESYNPDLIVMTFDSLLDEHIVERFGDRIINVHPALLPSFKGFNGIDNTLKSGVRYGGATVHFIDERIDNGVIIAQTVLPISPDFTAEIYGENLFKEMVKMLHQVIHWILSNEIQFFEGQIRVKNGNYSTYPICPSGTIVKRYSEDIQLFRTILQN